MYIVVFNSNINIDQFRFLHTVIRPIWEKIGDQLRCCACLNDGYTRFD